MSLANNFVCVTKMSLISKTVWVIGWRFEKKNKFLKSIAHCWKKWIPCDIMRLSLYFIRFKNVFLTVIKTINSKTININTH